MVELPVMVRAERDQIGQLVDLDDRGFRWERGDVADVTNFDMLRVPTHSALLRPVESPAISPSFARSRPQSGGEPPHCSENFDVLPASNRVTAFSRLLILCHGGVRPSPVALDWLNRKLRWPTNMPLPTI